jgi:hypothetical protein
MFCTDSSEDEEFDSKRKRRQRTRGKRIRYYQEQRYQQVRRSKRINEPAEIPTIRSEIDSTLSEITDLDQHPDVSSLSSENNQNQQSSGTDQVSENESEKDEEFSQEIIPEKSQRSARIIRRNRYQRQSSSDDDLGPRRISTRKVTFA